MRGRHTGRLISFSFPLVVADYEGERYRAPILRRYLALAPGARAHIPVDRHAPLEDFERIAAQIPVFRITAGGSAARDGGADQPATGTPG